MKLDRTDDWIYKVIDFIEDNIANPISLEELAELSGYSLRHFQRLFRQRTSENIAEYIRGRRLTVAMDDIVKAEKSIIDIAFEYQFESQQSFTRAFQARFTFPPIRFRNHNVVNPPSSKRKLTAGYLRMIESEDISLEPEIIHLDEMTFVGMRAVLDVNSYGDSEVIGSVSRLVNEFRRRKNEIGNIVSESPEKGELIMSYRVPKSERAHNDGIVFLAAAQVEAGYEIPQDMIRIETPASKFAKFEFQGGFEIYPHAGNYITGCWFPRSKYWIGNAPVLSYIQANPANSDAYMFKSILPLRPRHPRLVDLWWH
ncbi:MAG: helix-turn-helix domain-containing protein [Pseudomonadales bacterium]|nr:helix-turn-helix domain-containing protein [Pseudomonadales bacterium]